MRLRPWRKPALRPEPMARAAVVGDLVRATLQSNGECTWRARGSSMAGAIRDGDTVRLVPAGPVEPGDVVMAALPDDRLVIHRVERVADGRVQLRGDACRKADPAIPLSSVIAAVDGAPRPTLRALAYRLVAS